MTFITGVTGAFVGVQDFAPHLEFWCGELGWENCKSGVISAEIAQKVYHVEGEIEVKVLCAAGSDTGQVYLVRTKNADSLTPRYPHTSELGFHALDLYTKDSAATYEQMKKAGHKWVREPEAYKVPLGETVVEITEAFLFGPEGTAAVFVEAKNARVTKAWDINPDLPYTELTSVVCGVRDVEGLTAFFGPEGLGMAKWYDVSFTSEGLNKMAQLPSDAEITLVFLAGESTARIEVIKVNNVEPPRDLRAEQRPGKALGHSGWSFKTHDLDGALAVVTKQGGVVLSPPVVTDDPIHGKARLASAETPEGAFIELWEAI